MSDFKNDIECYTDNVYLDHVIPLIPRLMVYLLMLVLYISNLPRTPSDQRYASKPHYMLRLECRIVIYLLTLGILIIVALAIA